MPRFADVRTLSLGTKKITFLPDGGGFLDPVGAFPASSPEAWQRHPEYLDDRGRLIISIGGFLIRSGKQTIVVDTGLGPLTENIPGFGTCVGGKFLESLTAAETAPEEVTDVIFTHLHLDHCGWTSLRTENEVHLAFPRAHYFIADDEWRFWSGSNNPAGPHPELVQKPLEEKIAMVSDGDEIADGVRIIALPGHTPGHIGLAVSSGSERLMILGDAVHSPVQFDESEWSFVFDADPRSARQSREEICLHLAEEGAIGAFCHFADRVFGRLTQTRDRRTWVPL
ncbi:MAG: MBL fold metallo-hydrolase [Deltaproteobacteria bacterium]|nr:MBL fold metallo-hydrolase [Deltaproteobacteria bacterium]